MAEGAQPENADVADDAVLWRFLRPSSGFLQWWVIDQITGRPRPSSFAFEDDRDGAPPSVTIAAEAESLEAAIGAFEADGVVALTVTDVHQCGFTVRREPTEENPAHAVLVAPEGTSRSARRRMSSRLASKAEWVRLPAGLPEAT